jgi:hypothetical protein
MATLEAFASGTGNRKVFCINCIESDKLNNLMKTQPKNFKISAVDLETMLFLSYVYPFKKNPQIS